MVFSSDQLEHVAGPIPSIPDPPPRDHMANDDGPPDTPRPNGSPRRGRPQRSRNGRDSGTAPGVPDEDALPESAVATAEPEGAEPAPEPAAQPAAGAAAEARPEGVGPVPEAAP